MVGGALLFQHKADLLVLLTRADAESAQKELCKVCAANL